MLVNHPPGMPEEEISRCLRDGRVGMFPNELFSEAASNRMGGLNKLEQLRILRDTKPVSWLKPSLEIEINFGQFHMSNLLDGVRCKPLSVTFVTSPGTLYL